MHNYYYKESNYNSKICVILQLKLINKLSLSVCLFTLALYIIMYTLLIKKAFSP